MTKSKVNTSQISCMNHNVVYNKARITMLSIKKHERIVQDTPSRPNHKPVKARDCRLNLPNHSAGQSIMTFLEDDSDDEVQTLQKYLA